jgi:cell division transport system permease protein
VYALSQALRSLRRHPNSTFATFTTALVSFTLLFLLSIVLWNLERVVSSAQSELEIAAFLAPETDPAELLPEVQAISGVAQVTVVDKDQALDELQADYPYLRAAEDLVANPLPDTLRVDLSDPALIAGVAEQLAALPGVDQVEYGGEGTEGLVGFLAGLRIAANVLILLLIVNTFFSVMGTIRLSIENRKDELDIMRLVGASRRTIEFPFVLEGLVLTLLAGVISVVLGNLAYRYAAQAVQNLLAFIPVLAPAELIQASGALLLLSVLLGALGAWLTSRSYTVERAQL